MCDLADSTAFANQVDPEDARKVLKEFFERCKQIVERHKGYIARYLGDAVLVYFGYPDAHEHSAERAVRAALDLVSAIPAILMPSGGALQVRVGIATGVVIVGDILGDGAAREALVTGPSANLAARLQAAALPGTVVISDETRKLLGEMFECHPLGQLQFKGFSEFVTAWQVKAERRIVTRFDAFHPPASLTPLVGREVELALLVERWQLVREGYGQVVLVSGEAGIGKSRLLQELHGRLRPASPLALQLQCSSHYENSALRPLIDCLERWLGFFPDQEPESRLRQIESVVGQRYGRPAKDLQLIAQLLSVPYEARLGPLVMTAQRGGEESLRALVDLFEAIGRERPSLMLVEDIQWADPSTLRFLSAFADKVVRIPLLVLITHRPAFDLKLFAGTELTRLVLPRLSRVQRVAVVSRIAPGNPLSDAVLEHIVERSDGVPLFLEEVTKAILESAAVRGTQGRNDLTPGFDTRSIPMTLRDSLSARLNRSPEEKIVAQVGAAIGREFDYELLKAVVPLSQPELDQALRSLTQAGLTYLQETAAGDVFVFKHALVQDSAYEMLLKNARRELHGRIAAALEARFDGTLRTQPELLARHFSEAGLTEPAVKYWKMAGEHAAQRSASVEATHHLEKGLALLSTLADSATKWQQEVELRALLARVQIAADGYASPKVAETFARVRELFPHVVESAQKFVVLRGECQLLVVRGRYRDAAARAQDLSRLADEERNSAFWLDANLLTGLIHLYQGRFQDARRHLEKCDELYDPAVHLAHSVRQGVDIGSAYLAYLARALWFLGYPDSALRSGIRAVEIATATIPLGIAQASGMLAVVHHVRGNLTETSRAVGQFTAYAKEQGHAYWIAVGEILESWMRSLEHRTPDSVREIEQSIVAYRATGANLGVSWFLLLLAEACVEIGQYAEALEVLERAERFCDESGERYYSAEIERTKGDAQLARSGPGAVNAAESCFRRALEISRGQQARSWELRAAMSLARLWRGERKCAEGLKLLSEVQAGFTEGFDTVDLKQASALLLELDDSEGGKRARVIDQRDQILGSR